MPTLSLRLADAWGGIRIVALMRTDPSLLHHRIVTRSVGVLGLLGVALVHVLDLQSKFHEVPYLGFLYLGLVLARSPPPALS